MEKKSLVQEIGYCVIKDCIEPIVPLSELQRPGWRLLLIEDQVSDVFLAENMLEDSMPDYAWQVVDRPSLSGAITMLNHIKFDLALVDLTLQDMEGIGIIQSLRAAAPDLPILVYTGSSNLDLQNDAIEAGAHFCIEKGATGAKLVRAMIQCALEEKR